MGVKRQQDLTSSCTVVLLGDARAGKTAMVNRLLTDKFSEVRLREREKKKSKTKWVVLYKLAWCNKGTLIRVARNHYGIG